MNSRNSYSRIKITEVRVRNFRSLRNVNITLDWFTVLIGENNAGKSNFIDAIKIAIGIGLKRVEREDIYIDPYETYPPEDRESLIDIKIQPTDDMGAVISKFAEDNYWLGHWGDGISQEDNLEEFVGIRTRIYWNKEEMKYDIERNYLREWNKDPESILLSKLRGSVGFDRIESISLYVLDTNRDVKTDMEKPSSIWHQMVSSARFDETESKEIEGMIAELNKRMSTTGILSEIKEELYELNRTFNSERDGVSITTVPRQARELADNAGIGFATRGSSTFPIERHSSGTRSVASVLIFRAFIGRRIKTNPDLGIHPLLALEEPETHLHPQAEIAFYGLVKDMIGQKIISSHSSWLAAQVSFTDLRYFYKNGNDTVVVSIDKSTLTDEEVLSIKRKVLKTHGDLFFSRAIILYEGEETEDQAIPIFAMNYWGQDHTALGISMVNVNGRNYYPFLLLATKFQIKWYLLSDGEPDTIKAVQNAVTRVGGTISDPNLFIIPDGKNFEGYVSSEEYRDALVKMIADTKGTNDGHKEALLREWEHASLEDISKELSSHKLVYASKIANAIINMKDAGLQVPRVIRELFEKVSDDLKIEKRS